jgi:hypothetical protein
MNICLGSLVPLLLALEMATLGVESIIPQMAIVAFDSSWKIPEPLLNSRHPPPGSPGWDLGE